MHLRGIICPVGGVRDSPASLSERWLRGGNPGEEAQIDVMGPKQYIVRNSNGADLVELFLIAGIASVLGIRAFLSITGYPQLGGDGLHIAHMLWGGLFMMAALLLLFALLGAALHRWAAVLAGIGFGTFIDELGKFITSDNNYFYQPTVGLVYIIFVAVFLLLSAMRNKLELTPHEALANTLNRLEGSVNGRVDAETRVELLELLDKADPGSPLVQALQSHLQHTKPLELSGGRTCSLSQLRSQLLRGYSSVVQRRWFPGAIIAIFAAQAVGQVVIVGVFFLGKYTAITADGVTFAEGAQLVSSSLAGGMMLWGLRQLRRSRQDAYRWFLRATLLSIFVTQVFVFFEYQLAGITGLIWNILIYVALRLMTGGEEELARPYPETRPAWTKWQQKPE